MKGIDPKAREVAKDLARQQGMTLGEWLNRMILEDDAPAERGETASERPGGQDSEPLVIPPVMGGEPRRPLGASITREPYYLETPRPIGEAPPRYEIPPNPSDEVGRMAQALDRLSARIEASEARSTLAISGVEQSVRGALARLDGGEREQVSVAARFEGAVQEVQAEQVRLTERLRRIEQEAAGPRSVEALRSLEGALGKVAGRMYEGEEQQRQAIAALEARLADVEAADRASLGGDVSGLVEQVVAKVGARLEEAESRTSQALETLGAAFSTLDERLGAVEGAGGARLQALAEELSQTMAKARSDMAAKLADVSDGRFDRVERKLGEMTAHVQAAETRSAQAIERMGREVVNMADNLSRRVAGVEASHADTVQKMGGEMARIANAVEQRLTRADTVQAQAMEKLGNEIARITERLAERIANAERRSALAIDDVGEQVARVTERINQRNERSATELAERIRQSEERTAKLLEEAREKIDASLANTHRKLSEQVASAPPPPVSTAMAAADMPPPSVARSPFDLRRPFGGEAIPEETFAPRDSYSRDGYPNDSYRGDSYPAAPAFDAEPLGDFPAAADEPLGFSHEDFEAADGFAPIAETVAEETRLDSIDDAFLEPAPPPAPSSTRDVIEQARAAARAASQPTSAGPRQKTAGTSLFAAFANRGAKPPKEKRASRKASKAQTNALVSLAVLAVGGVLVAYGVVTYYPAGKKSERVAGAIEARQADEAAAKALAGGSPADATASPGDARAAMMLAPQVAAPTQAAPAPTTVSLFEDAQRRLAAGDKGGMESLRRAANLGYAPAQYFLAKAYEEGEGGLKKDLAEARRWTERAAQGGDQRAMHNMGLYAFNGDGGPQNATTAAQWFRRAADLGLVDSQYNLGLLYERGTGVSQNAAEAYKWYLIAGRSGDGESRKSAARIKSQLTPEAQAAAERAAAGYRTTGSQSAAPVNVATAPASLVIAQKALSRLGYYQGPQDGAPSAALKLAIAAWQRDQGANPTGELDAPAVAKLANYAK